MAKNSKEYRRRWEAKNPDKVRAYREKAKKHYRRSDLKKHYDMTESQYEKMLEAQHGRCLICGETNGPMPLFVDHDHKTQRVRSLLCINCNTGLGTFKDSPELLRLAILYLELWSQV